MHLNFEESQLSTDNSGHHHHLYNHYVLSPSKQLLTSLELLCSPQPKRGVLLNILGNPGNPGCAGHNM